MILSTFSLIVYRCCWEIWIIWRVKIDLKQKQSNWSILRYSDYQFRSQHFQSFDKTVNWLLNCNHFILFYSAGNKMIHIPTYHDSALASTEYPKEVVLVKTWFLQIPYIITIPLVRPSINHNNHSWRQQIKAIRKACIPIRTTNRSPSFNSKHCNWFNV